MSLSAATKEIVDTLRRLAEEYGFGFSSEARYFPELGKRSERVDAQFLLPNGRPGLRFEIDNAPDRAAHNRLKIFGNVYSLSTLPLVALSVLHGRAATSLSLYPGELLGNGFVTPPRFLDVLTLDNSNAAMMATQLQTWFRQLISALGTAPEGETVFDIAELYQPLVANVSLGVAAAHLEMHSELAWFFAERKLVRPERAANLSVALARMLQRTGLHQQAVRILDTFRTRLPNAAAVGSSTVDDARAVDFLLHAPALDDTRALDHLTMAIERLDAQYHKSKFHWRRALVEINSGNPTSAAETLERYLQDMEGSRISLSNIALCNAVAAIRSGSGDPREHASTYSRHERALLYGSDTEPDGTVHGVVASLYLRVIAEVSVGNTEAAQLFPKLEAFRKEARIPRTADGFREIATILLMADQTPCSPSQESSGSLAALMSHQRGMALWRLCVEVDDACKP